MTFESLSPTAELPKDCLILLPSDNHEVKPTDEKRAHLSFHAPFFNDPRIAALVSQGQILSSNWVVNNGNADWLAQEDPGVDAIEQRWEYGWDEELDAETKKKPKVKSTYSDPPDAGLKRQRYEFVLRLGQDWPWGTRTKAEFMTFVQETATKVSLDKSL